MSNNNGDFCMDNVGMDQNEIMDTRYLNSGKLDNGITQIENDILQEVEVLMDRMPHINRNEEATVSECGVDQHKR